MYKILDMETKTQTSKSELDFEMARRDLRFYKLHGFDTLNSLALANLAYSGQFDEVPAQVKMLADLAWDSMDEISRREVLYEVKRCPLGAQA